MSPEESKYLSRKKTKHNARVTLESNHNNDRSEDAQDTKHKSSIHEKKRYEKPTQSQESNTIPKPGPSFNSTGPVVRLAYTTKPNQVTQRTTSIPRSSAPVYLKFHMPSRLTSQNAPEAECIPRFPALPRAPSAATDLSIKPCWTIVLFTVKRKRGDLEDSVGWVAAMRALRTTFYRELMSCLA